MRAFAAVIPLLAPAVYGCQAPLGPNHFQTSTFTVSPATVAPGDSFAVVFTLRNPTVRPVTITSSYGCLFFLRALRGSDTISVQGLTYFCTASFTTFSIPPHDSLIAVQRAVAAERIGVGAAAPLPPGDYRIQTMMNATLPNVEATLTVVATSGATWPAHEAVVVRRPLERERIYLDGGRRTTQLKRDSLGSSEGSSCSDSSPFFS